MVHRLSDKEIKLFYVKLFFFTELLYFKSYYSLSFSEFLALLEWLEKVSGTPNDCTD